MSSCTSWRSSEIPFVWASRPRAAPRSTARRSGTPSARRTAPRPKPRRLSSPRPRRRRRTFRPTPRPVRPGRSGYRLGMDFAKTARNLAVADIALAFARDRVATMLPGVEPRKKRRPGAKTLLLGGGVAAAVVALFFKRDAVKGLLPGGD